MDRSLNLEGYQTDLSLARSTTLSMSASSLENSRSNPEESSENNSDQEYSSKKRRSKNKRVELIPPVEKLEKCEKRYLVYLESRDNDRAMQELLKFPPLVRLIYGDQSWRYAEASWRVAKGYLDLKNLPKQSVKHSELAKSLILQGCHIEEREKPLYIRCVSEVYLCLGKALLLVGNSKYKEAENALQKSWHVLSSLKKPGQQILLPSASLQGSSLNLKIDIKVALADLYMLTKNIDKAKSCLNYVIKQVSEHSSSEDQRLIPIYNKLAKAEKAKKKSEVNYDSVVEYRLRAHEISSSVNHVNSLNVADTAYSLGVAYASIDSDDAQRTAETYLTEAIKTYESNPDTNDEKTIKAKDALYKVWTRTGREKEAAKQLKKSVQVKNEVFGLCSPQVADTYKLVGGIHLSQGDLIPAHKFLGKCLEIEQLLYGAQHWRTKSTLSTLELIGQNPALVAARPKAKQLRERPHFQTTVKPKR